jgi:hypothetical protein
MRRESPAADLPYLPPPPPPGNIPALLRWSLAVLKASAGRRNRLAIRRHYAAEGAGGGESLGTVAIAMGADVAMFAAKAAAAALTGSAALFAETLHSLADTGNQLLLLTGLRRARRRPDARHPFGYGAELFYWSLLAELRERIAQDIPRVTAVSLMPVVAVEQPPEPTPWDRDYWLRRFPDDEQA